MHVFLSYVLRDWCDHAVLCLELVFQNMGQVHYKYFFEIIFIRDRRIINISLRLLLLEAGTLQIFLKFSYYYKNRFFCLFVLFFKTMKHNQPLL